MTSTVLAVSAAYVVMGVLLLTVGLTSRFAWWVKAVAIVVASAFFIEVFFATKGLLGWPGAGQLPPQVPAAVGEGGGARPRDRRPGRDLSVGRGGRRQQRAGRRAACVSAALLAPARRPFVAGARRDHARQAAAGHGRGAARARRPKQEPNSDEMKVGSRTEGGVTTLDLEQFQLLQQAQRVEFRPCRGRSCRRRGRDASRRDAYNADNKRWRRRPQTDSACDAAPEDRGHARQHHRQHRHHCAAHSARHLGAAAACSPASRAPMSRRCWCG